MKKENSSKQNKKGFTLLELLVVVLIIAILSAIALPQYQLAVDKAQFAKMQTIVSSVRKSYQNYVLLHGKGPKSFKELDIDILHEGEEYDPMGFFKCVTLTDMYICMSGGGVDYGGNVRAFKKDLSFIYLENLLKSGTLTDIFSRQCHALKNSTRANRLCNEVGYKEAAGDIISGSTPSGNYKDYYRYYIN